MSEVRLGLTTDDLKEGDMFRTGNNGKVYMKIAYPYSIDLTNGNMILVSDMLAIEQVYKYTINREKEN